MSCMMYKKRSGTSGIRGQLYETKLISLIHFRAIHDDSIEEFHLASNVEQMGTIDDICFKAKLKGFDRPLTVFIQAKHKEDDKQTLKIDMRKYFESYLTIRRKFELNSETVFSGGKFEETECLFVIYTTAKDDFDNVLLESKFASKLYNLIGTGGTAKQLCKNEENVELLCKIAMKEEIISLARRIAQFMNDEDNFQMLLNDELVIRYHVLLAQKVLEVSEIKPERHRIAFFRQDFFDAKEEFIILLKDTLYTEILKIRKLGDTDVKTLLIKFLEEPSDVKILSELIGTVIKYNNGQIECVDKRSTKAHMRQLNEVCVSQATVNQAIELAAKDILSERKFKVPTAFGNKDITIKGSNAKVERRLIYLASRFFDLFEKSKTSNNNIVTIEESMEKGLLQLNGGIAGAVGNILVSDGNTKLMKITENYELLGDLAKRLFEKLKRRIHNLHEYKFSLKVKKFPKLSLDRSEYDVDLAKDFLNKLLIYSNQANETRVGEIIKKEIEDSQCDGPETFQIKTDAIFLYYHDEIQKWWMEPKQASYLTKKSTMYEKAIHNIIKAPLMSVVNIMYKMKHINYTFNEHALMSLKLPNQHSRTAIITENSTLTVAKVIQCLKNKDHVILDLEYILNLPKNDRNALCSELTNNNEEKILIVVCDKIHSFEYGHNSLEYIENVFHDIKTIMIANQTSVDARNKYFAHSDDVVYDTKINLSDMSEESQKSILKTTRVKFQGKEVFLDQILDDESLACVEGEVLNKIISKETILVGKPIGNSNYDEIKYFYVDRRVKKTEDEEDGYKKGNHEEDRDEEDGDGEDEDDDHIVVKSFHDIADDVVLVTAIPGMGKSTLLTHLSLKTKELEPKIWILRINLLVHSREFSMWKQCETDIDFLETLNFMCQVVLREKLGEENKVKTVLEEANGDVYLKYCTGDQETVFELKLFLHFYNREKLIILFDGFDEICPHYTNEVINCLKTVRNWPKKHKMWITSRSYNEVKTILQREFGTSYKILPFSYKDKERYLEMFWKFNLMLKEFDRKQLENVNDFIEFMLDSQNFKFLKFGLSITLETYFNACYYFMNQIENTYLPLWTYKTNTKDQETKRNFHMNYNNCKARNNCYYKTNIPLLLYLTADYFQNDIKDVNKKNNKWNVDSNTFMFYERFIETKLKKIRFQDKNKMDIYNPDIIISYDKERAEFLAKHKKLGAYAIFYRQSDQLFNTKELYEIKDTIQLIENGGDKTGLIHSVANDIPIFTHMTFTEYFAVEYVCDLLKSETCSEKLKSWMHFILNVMFSVPSFEHVMNFLNYKMQIDEALMSVFENNNEVIFNLLMEQGKAYSEYCVNSYDEIEARQTNDNSPYWSLLEAASWELDNLLSLFMDLLEIFINEDNLNDFLQIICGTRILRNSNINDYDVFTIFVLNKVREIDKSKLNSVLLDNYCFLPIFLEYDAITNEEIVEIIHKQFDIEHETGSFSKNRWENVRLFSTRPYVEIVDRYPELRTVMALPRCAINAIVTDPSSSPSNLP